MAAATTSTRATSSLMSPFPSQSNTTTANNNHNECCMCGDFGLSSELYRCKICRFRSQHRYCSNLYPKADSYRVCNWCLIQKDVGHINTTTPIQRLTSNSPNPSPPYKHKDHIKHNNERLDPHQASDNDNNNNNNTTNKMMKKMKINSPPSSTHAADQNHNICSPGSVNKCRRPQFQTIGSPTKKLRSSPEGMASPSTRKRIVAIANNGGGGEKLIRRTKSEEISNRNKTSGTTKHVFRNKVVRRYKHLDEVSC